MPPTFFCLNFKLWVNFLTLFWHKKRYGLEGFSGGLTQVYIVAILKATQGCIPSWVLGLLPTLLFVGFSGCLESTQSVSTSSLLYA